MIPYGKQNISQADIDAVIETLNSDWLTQGPRVDAFEQAICDYSGSSHAVAVNSATSALHIACLALDLGKGDSLWTSPNTFVASANCGLYCGASVDFVDIDPVTYNMSVSALEKKLVAARLNNTLPKIVIPVHFSGQSCDMKAIALLAEEYGFHVIEDASHAVGGRYNDKPVGCCEYSDITIFSFHPVKIVTTGEGGVATTNNKELAEHMRRLRSHGITRDESLFTLPAEGDWSYQQIDLGFNYRITDLQCALGISQMRRLDEFVARRHQLADNYDLLLEDLPIITPTRVKDVHSALHLYVIKLEQCEATKRIHVFNAMRNSGIGVNIHYIPVHTQPYYRQLGFNNGDFPEAEAYYRCCLSLPLFYDLTEKEQQHVRDALDHALA